MIGSRMFLLVALGLALAAQASAVEISSNISTWLPAGSTMQQTHDRSRMWDRNMLDDGVAVLKLRRLARVLSRLDQGLPLTVVMVGSSITQDFGGYFFSDNNMNDLSKRLNITNPVETFSGMRRDGQGWGRVFMKMVNHTWPHVNHTLLNYGRAACGLYCYSNLPCLTDNMPNVTDLIIMESVFLDSNGGNLEQLLTRLYDVFGWRQETLPSLMFIKSPTIVDWPHYNVSDVCIRDSRHCDTVCAMDGPTPFTHLLDGKHYSGTVPDSQLGSVESEFFMVASYYHVPTISPRWFYVAALQSGAHRRRNLSTCAYLAGFMADPLHVRYGQGTQLWGELVFNLLYLTQRLVPRSDVEQLLQNQPEIPAKPIFQREEIIIGDCPRDHGAGTLSGAWDMNSTDKTWQYIEMDSGKAGSSATLQLAPPGPNTTTTTTPLINNTSDGSSNSNSNPNQVLVSKKRKPGWVCTTPGGVLEFKFTSRVKSIWNTVGVIQYLSSYEHMGQATVECIGDCNCAPTVFDGYRPERRVSVPALHEFNVTSSERCLLRVTVRNTTRSGEYKVKLISVWAKGP